MQQFHSACNMVFKKIRPCVTRYTKTFTKIFFILFQLHCKAADVLCFTLFCCGCVNFRNSTQVLCNFVQKCKNMYCSCIEGVCSCPTTIQQNRSFYCGSILLLFAHVRNAQPSRPNPQVFVKHMPVCV